MLSPRRQAPDPSIEAAHARRRDDCHLERARARTEGTVFEDEPLTVTDLVRYQGASGDMNPIGDDTEFAQKAGFPQPFAVGMLTAGILATWATDWLGAENVRRFKVQWREYAWLGDVLTYSGAVVFKREDGGQRVVDLEMAVRPQAGSVHLKGWAPFVVP